MSVNPDLLAKDCTLRLYDFPSSYTQSDLRALIKDLPVEELVTFKWINDTETLLVFKSKQTARKVYLRNIGALEFKLDVYSIPDSDGSKDRPIKTDVVAKRMVAGALGIKVKDKECHKLEKAIQDKKMLEKRQQDLDQAWEE